MAYVLNGTLHTFQVRENVWGSNYQRRRVSNYEYVKTIKLQMKDTGE